MENEQNIDRQYVIQDQLAMITDALQEELLKVPEGFWGSIKINFCGDRAVNMNVERSRKLS